MTRWAAGLEGLAEWRASVRSDLAAGAVLAAVAVPLGMAYAGLAGLQPVAGLYATVAGFVAYAVFGPSRTLVTGPDSSTAPLVAAAIVPLAAAGAGTRAELAALLGVMVGLMMIVVRVARLGFVTDLLAKPVRLGYLNGVAITIIVGQLSRLAGFGPEGDGVLGRIGGFEGAREVPGMMLYRFDAPLFFANARIFRERLDAALAEREGVSLVILAAEPVIDVDTTAADVLAETIHDLETRGVAFGFAELKSTVRERLVRYGIMDLVDPAFDHPTIGSAVHAHVARTGAAWVDWEDQATARPETGDMHHGGVEA